MSENLTKFVWKTIKMMIPDAQCPIEVRSNIPIEQRLDINYKSKQVFAAIAYELGCLFKLNNPLSSPMECTCYLIDYMKSKKWEFADKQHNFFKQYFYVGVEDSKNYDETRTY